MNNISYKKRTQKKAGIFACLFCLCLFTVFTSFAQQWTFDENTQKAYDLVLNLQTAEAFQIIPKPETAAENYVISFAQALELLITEDVEKFSFYEDQFRERIDMKMKSTKENQFLRAEMHLQWAFIYMKFGQEIEAASQLRQAYQITKECRRKAKDFLAIQKTAGVLEIIIGSVPQKYAWVLNILGMQGSVIQGLTDLENVRKSESPLAFEADLLRCIVYGFVFQKPDTGFSELKRMLVQKPENKLALYIGAGLAMKNSQNEEALLLLNTLSENDSGVPLHYTQYLKGEVYLHRADYVNAIKAYRSFINDFSGQNYIKDAWYKLGLCHWLNGNANDAISFFSEAKTNGKEATEADKSAATSLAQQELPHIALSKVRYAIDGGYYPLAGEMLGSIADRDLPTRRDQVEYYYRKARLAHKTNQLQAAQLFYKQTIDMAGDETWYFAPNACLQLGYILQTENEAEAKRLFQKALTYRKHEYKNSIDSKARSALSRFR